ncbi:MAG TPA: cupin domain-containing protein [Bryobacteraceae bacterium]|nr:cupin domain-containing protein [Bryobacteraceae bacterium]
MIRQKYQLGRAAGLMFVCGVFAVSGLRITHAQEKPNPNFTGGVVTTVTENSKGNIAHFHFGPGARTKWHIHEGGQIILVEDGVALVQSKGGPLLELHAGETTYVPPGVAHWHGGGTKEGGTQFNISRGGIQWLDDVTDAEFNAKPERLGNPH